MSDVYKEVLIKKKKTPADTAKKAGLIAAVVVLAASTMIIPLMLLPTVILAILSYYLISWLKVEYEYLYVNGDFDVDRIMNQTRRKRAGSYELSNLELIAPSDSRDLDDVLRGKNPKICDYTSGQEGVKSYTAVYNGEKGMQAVKLELDEDILQDLRRRAPRKISRECLLTMGR